MLKFTKKQKEQLRLLRAYLRENKYNFYTDVRKGFYRIKLTKKLREADTDVILLLFNLNIEASLHNWKNYYFKEGVREVTVFKIYPTKK